MTTLTFTTKQKLLVDGFEDCMHVFNNSELDKIRISWTDVPSFIVGLGNMEELKYFEEYDVPELHELIDNELFHEVFEATLAVYNFSSQYGREINDPFKSACEDVIEQGVQALADILSNWLCA